MPSAPRLVTSTSITVAIPLALMSAGCQRSAPEKSAAPAKAAPTPAPAFIDSLQNLEQDDSRCVALGDVDGDGDLDAWVGNSAVGSTLIWVNDGKGRFTKGQKIEWDAVNETPSAALADLDGDGDLDAWVACNDGVDGGRPNRVYVNDGKGTFKDSTQKLGNSFSSSVTLGDVDGDGDLDAVVGNGGDDGSPNLIWINDGKGTFADSGQKLGKNQTQDVALGDLDGDGDLDVWATNTGLNMVWINDGKGSYTLSGKGYGKTGWLASDDGQGVRLVDIDGDADLDAVVVNSGPNHIWINDGKGTFTESPHDLSSANFLMAGMVAAESAPESASAQKPVQKTSANSTKTEWTLESWEKEHPQEQKQEQKQDQKQAQAAKARKQQADALTKKIKGMFSSDFEHPFDDSKGLVVADVDGDGDLDVVVANQGGSSSRVWFNQGKGVFTDDAFPLPNYVPLITLIDGSPLEFQRLRSSMEKGGLSCQSDDQAIAVGDLDGDKVDDLFIVNEGGSRVWFGTGNQKK